MPEWNRFKIRFALGPTRYKILQEVQIPLPWLRTPQKNAVHEVQQGVLE